MAGYAAWENVSASGYVPPGVPFTYDWKLEVESVQERGTKAASGAAAPADPRAPTASDLMPPSVWQDTPSTGEDSVAGLVIPLVARMSLGLQGGVAEVRGDPAPQDLWQVGTTGSWLRGHKDPVEASRTWMGRVDLQRTVRFLRLSVFGDWRLHPQGFTFF